MQDLIIEILTLIAEIDAELEAEDEPLQAAG